jgi:predicted kinase
MSKGRIIIICGLPGSGKSTLAKKLSSEPGAISFIPDEWMIRLFSGSNLAINRERVERIQFELSMKLANQGMICILENGFWGVEERLKLINEAEDNSVKVEAFFMLVNEDELKRRIHERNNNKSEYDYHMDDKMIKDCLGKFEEPSDGELSKYCNYKIIRH